MIKAFSKLSAEEIQLLEDALPMITVLVAGADGEIDEDEITRAENLTHIRSYASKNENLSEFYNESEEGFTEKIKTLVNELPAGVAERQAVLTERLSKINEVMPKVDSFFAPKLYDSYISFAENVAKASGGILGMMSIGPNEHKVVDLPMINKPA